jgi:glycosyltransferase involved in cell wall biosynthesis
MSRRLKILLLCHNVAGMGTCIRFEQIGRQLVRYGHHVALIAGQPSWSGRLTIDDVGGVRRILVPDIVGQRLRNGGLGLADVLYRTLHVLKHEYDLIHISEHRPATAIPSWAARRFRNVPVISDWSDWWGRGGIVESRSSISRALLAGPETYLEESIHRDASAVTVISRVLEQRALKLGIPANRLMRLPNGADTEAIRPGRKELARTALGLPGDGQFAVYAGFAPIDMDLLWDSFAEVARRAKQKVYLLVLGRRWALPARLRILRGRILQKGRVPRETYPLYLASGDVMLLPLRNRIVNSARWPGKLGDYLAAGRPIVANPTGEVREVFDRSPSSIGVLAGETVAEFAAGILHILDDPAMGDSMGANARSLAETMYAWPLVVRQLDTFYEEMLG